MCVLSLQPAGEGVPRRPADGTSDGSEPTHVEEDEGEG